MSALMTLSESIYTLNWVVPRDFVPLDEVFFYSKKTLEEKLYENERYATNWKNQISNAC